jgi:hypothetical protein
MRTGSILLALVAVLGAAREAVGQPTRLDYAIEIADCRYGISECPSLAAWLEDSDHTITSLHLGPVGTYHVPFTATQGLIGFIVIVAMLIVLPAVAVVGWKRNDRPNRIYSMKTN